MARKSSTLGERIKQVRDGRYVTQSEFAALLRSRKGTRPDPALVSRWERDVTEPSLHYLRQIAELGGVTIGDLYGENGEEAA